MCPWWKLSHDLEHCWMIENYGKKDIHHFFTNHSLANKIGENIIIEFYTGLPEKYRHTVIDIGCSYGFHTARMHPHFKMTYGFDPVIEQKKIIDDIGAIFYGTALGNEEKCQKFFVIKNKHVGLSSFYLDDKMLKNPIEERLITVKKLDSYKFSHISFIKIDSEGSEFDILQGAKASIKIHQPIIVFEHARYNPKNRPNKDQFYNFFQEINYDLFDLFGFKYEESDWDEKGAWFLFAFPTTHSTWLKDYLKTVIIKYLIKESSRKEKS